MKDINIPIPQAGIPKYPAKMPLVHGEEDDLIHRLKKGLSNKLRDMLVSSPFGVNILHVRGEYGSGKTKTTYSMIYEIYHPDEATGPYSIVTASGQDVIDLIRKREVLAIYLTFEKAYLGKHKEPNISSIFKSALDEIRQPTEIPNKKERNTIPRELIQQLEGTTIENTEQALKILRKHFDKIIIIVDEIERILELTQTERQTIMGSLRDDFINRFGESDYGTYLFLLYEPRIAFIIPPAISGRGREFETGRFSIRIAKKVLEMYLEETEYMRLFSDEIIRSIFELSHRCGRQFLGICRDALIQALGKEKSRIDYEDILNGLEGVRGPGGEKLLSEAYYSDIKSILRRKKPVFVKIFRLMLGEYFPHSVDEMTKKLGIDGATITEFVDKFSEDVPELPVSPLITQVYLVGRKGVEKAARKHGVTLDILDGLIRYRNSSVVTGNVSDFRMELINKAELHKSLLEEGKKDGYMISPQAFKSIVGSPVPREILDLINNFELRRRVEEYFSTTKSIPYRLEQEVIKGLNQIFDIMG